MLGYRSASLLWLAGVLVACGGIQTGDEGDVPGTPRCVPGCIAPSVCCINVCVNPENDAQHCGACNVDCGAGMQCIQGKCAPIPCRARCGAGAGCCGIACCANGDVCCASNAEFECKPATSSGACPNP